MDVITTLKRKGFLDYKVSVNNVRNLVFLFSQDHRGGNSRMMETKLEQSTLHPLCRYAGFNSLSIDAIFRVFYYPTAISSEEKVDQWIEWYI